MDGREIEPRTVLWAVAEISWQDASGSPCRAPATLEDTSISGACVRVKRPFEVGSRVTIRWQRDQFFAVARNCRSDGRDYLLGLRREPNRASALRPPLPKDAPSEVAKTQPVEKSRTTVPSSSSKTETPTKSVPPRNAMSLAPSARSNTSPVLAAEKVVEGNGRAAQTPSRDARGATPATSPFPSVETSVASRIPGASPGQERKAMPSKTIFPKFWRRQHDVDAPDQAKSKEASVNKPTSPAVIPAADARAEMLSYEDIYHAAGIMSPRSGYGIHKVVEMLNSARIRDLSKDIQRASVLMALDAAGTSVDDLLQDATRRQQALNSYEAGKKKQVEDFESQKSRENTEIEAEMERIRTHYAERAQRNRDLVAQEKDSLRNWQMAMQHESQRIADVIVLCGKQPASLVIETKSVPSPAPDKTSSPTTVENAKSTAAGQSV